MATRSALITGSTGGIGGELANQLSSQGWNLILLNRSEQKTRAQLDQLELDFPAQAFSGYCADFLEIEDLRRTVREIGAAHPRINAIYNNAGFLSGSRTLSAQNLEAHFAVNTVAPYLIVKELVTNLAAAAAEGPQSVVINVSSEVVTGVKSFDCSALADPPHIGGLLGAYAQSKLAANVFAQALKEPLAAQRVSILSVDPGATRTPMIDRGDGMPWFIKLLRPLLFKPVEQQVAALVGAVNASLEQRQSGVFISGGKVKPDSPFALDPGQQNRMLTLLDGLIE